jgi:high-affinity Fe2+/Pb2+ permease
MKNLAKIVIAILIVVVAWKILKGIVGLLIGIAVAGLIIYGGMKLIEGPKR